MLVRASRRARLRVGFLGELPALLRFVYHKCWRSSKIDPGSACPGGKFELHRRQGEVIDDATWRCRDEGKEKDRPPLWARADYLETRWGESRQCLVNTLRFYPSGYFRSVTSPT